MEFETPNPIGEQPPEQPQNTPSDPLVDNYDLEADYILGLKVRPAGEDRRHAAHMRTDWETNFRKTAIEHFGLPEDVTDDEIRSVLADSSRKRTARKYGLPEDATVLEIGQAMLAAKEQDAKEAEAREDA